MANERPEDHDDFTEYKQERGEDALLAMLEATMSEAATWSSVADAQLASALTLVGSSLRYDPKQLRGATRLAAHAAAHAAAKLSEVEQIWKQLEGEQ